MEIERKFNQLNANGSIVDTTPVRRRLNVDMHPKDPFKEIDMKQNSKMLFEPRTPQNANEMAESVRLAVAKRAAEKLGLSGMFVAI